jgi:hypothetical protein
MNMITLEEILTTRNRVVDLINRNRLFEEPFAVLGDNVFVTTNIRLADCYSWMQDISELGDLAGKAADAKLTGDFEFWPGLREREWSYLKQDRPKIQNKVSDYLSDYVWKKLLLPKHLEEETNSMRDEIFVDFQGALLNEFFGRPSVLFTRILEVYEQGGWPCGWLGKYPDGKLIVLDPNPK